MSGSLETQDLMAGSLVPAPPEEQEANMARHRRSRNNSSNQQRGNQRKKITRKEKVAQQEKDKHRDGGFSITVPATAEGIKMAFEMAWMRSTGGPPPSPHERLDGPTIPDRLTALTKGESWSVISRPLLIDGSVCDVPVGGSVRGFRYRNGETITKTAEGYRWESRTLCGGTIEQNLWAALDSTGLLVSGEINCFELGTMPLDQVGIEEYAADALTGDDWSVQ